LLSASFAIVEDVPPDVQHQEDQQRNDDHHLETSENGS